MTFEELYHAQADSVYTFLRHKIRDRRLVEDLFQDTFLAAYRQWSLGRRPEHPRAWLLTIAHRRMVDRLRREPPVEAPLRKADDIERSNPDVCTEKIDLERLMERLDDASRAILHALYAQGLSIRETADLLGLPEGTVKSRSHAAKKKLSVWMKEERADGR